MSGAANVIDASHRFLTRLRILGRISGAAVRRVDRQAFRAGLADARAGLAPPTFACDAYRRARSLAVELLGQSLVEVQPAISTRAKSTLTWAKRDERRSPKRRPF